ncbi:MAG: beta-propeller fold lactonase family protein [Planctomycetota bacterium]
MSESQDGTLVYTVSRSQDALLVLDASNLSLQQNFTGALNGLDGAADITVSADDRFIYATGQDGNTLAVFERDLGSDNLSLVQIVNNGVEGVRGLLEPSDVTLTPDEQFLLATGQESNAVSIFSRDETNGTLLFVQVLRNNIGGTVGLRAPSAITVDPSGETVYAGSLGQTGIDGGLVTFNNLAFAGTLPEPISLLTTFDHIEALSVSTAGGQDVLTLIAAPEPEVATTTLDTGDNNDIVTLLDLSASTVVHLGSGNDEAQLRAETPSASVVVHGEDGADTIAIERAGDASTTEVFGGDDRDVIFVSGSHLPASATTIAHGDDPTGVPPSLGDTLLFDPQNPTPSIPNYTPAVPTPGAGSINVIGQGVLDYDGLEAVRVIAAPIIDFVGTPFQTSEGSGITLQVNVTPLGSTGRLLGPVLWDLDGDGRFGEASGEILILSWEHLVDFGLSDDRVYQIGARATNEDGFTASAFTTLTIKNTPPTVTVTGAGQAFVQRSRCGSRLRMACRLGGWVTTGSFWQRHHLGGAHLRPTRHRPDLCGGSG